LSGYTNWEPIGDSTNPFTGKYDGGNYSISNLTIDTPNGECRGLFGVINNSDPINVSEIKNINLVNVDITGNNNLGALAGISCAKVSNCHSSGAIQCTGSEIGGLIGWQNEAGDSYVNHVSDLIRCSSSVTITDITTGEQNPSYDLGGLVGFVTNHIIDQCWASGNISGRADQYSSEAIGGFAGEISTDFIIIANCYATGNVEGYQYVGGFVGMVSDNRETIIENCFSKGLVTATSDCGGFCGGLFGLL
jgi:hypothetical protein